MGFVERNVDCGRRGVEECRERDFRGLIVDFLGGVWVK